MVSVSQKFQLNYRFLGYLDKFSFASGSLPILITAPHAMSIKDSPKTTPTAIYAEITNHFCDYAVEPLIALLQESRSFFILKNELNRAVIDMNRTESRRSDEIDENDTIFRQLIRFILGIIKSQFKKLPIVLDLHSFPAGKSDWGEYDMAILIQTRTGARINPSFVDFTANYFNEHGWRVLQTDVHNKDDIVEEVRMRDLGLPILLEINEQLISDNLLGDLAEDITNYLMIGNERNIEFTKTTSDAFHFSDFPTSEIAKYLNQIQHTQLKHEISQFITLSSRIKALTNICRTASDAITFPTLNDLAKNIAQVGQGGYNDSDIIESVVVTIAKEHKTIIIPIELAVLHVKELYVKINNETLHEWHIDSGSIITHLSNYSLRDKVLVPRFQRPLPEKATIYQSFPSDDFYVNFMIYLPNITKIPENRLKSDIDFIQQVTRRKIQYENPSRVLDALREAFQSP